ncbi:MAG: hypothetical protein ISS49_08865 [Anaerolineae bacterium]|nr:hypothetical protein [Anaerolineae bacterium]
MDTVLEFVQQHKTLVALTGGAILGLLLGLAIGWWWWPVEWTNSTPGNLHPDFQSEYILWVAERYADTNDLDWAHDQLGADYWKENQLAETLEMLAEERGGHEAVRLRALAQALETPSEPTPPVTSVWERLRPVATVCGVALLVITFVGGTLLLVSRLRKPRTEMGDLATGVFEESPVLSEQVSWGAKGPPLAQFVTTYTLGDDHYDPSFSIELESGEFMGECGAGISETIGVGEPSKVTAFEVWLFDKNDIRTVTKVLMSDYAFHDEALRTKLAPKGEPTLAEVEKDVILETKTLRVQAHIVEVEHGMGNLPPSSFFDRLTIGLAAWVKPGQEGTQPAAERSDAPIMSPTL